MTGIGAAMTRILLVDDHDVVREGLRAWLDREPDLEVVAEAGTAADALEHVRSFHPEVVVLDVRLPDRSGVEVCRDIRSEHADVAVLMLTSSTVDQALFDAIIAGASGYVLKKIRDNDLVGGIRRVAAGESMLDPALTASALDRIRHLATHGGARHRGLTPTESRILELVANGNTNWEIGDRVGLDETAVRGHVSSILAKLQAWRRAEAVAYFAEQYVRLDHA
jgi:DNA-binding NarL/FixJ family response regulator